MKEKDSRTGEKEGGRGLGVVLLKGGAVILQAYDYQSYCVRVQFTERIKSRS